jgi:hypothetical protein
VVAAQPLGSRHCGWVKERGRPTVTHLRGLFLYSFAVCLLGVVYVNVRLFVIGISASAVTGFALWFSYRSK